jgi:hypothetical protein
MGVPGRHLLSFSANELKRFLFQIAEVRRALPIYSAVSRKSASINR